MPHPTVAPPTVGHLLADGDLGLRLEWSAGDDTLERPIRWVHGSDLADPTPFLDDGMVLLTTGAQFDGPAPEYDAYVRRLARRGVAALGFGTEVVRAGIPEALADACRRHGLTLFEVPYRTPFIAVARAGAEAIAAAAFARRSWALTAQRAISLAALRTDALGATLAELARQLGAWVGLFDAAGAPVHAFPTTLDGRTAAEVRTEAEAILARGSSAASIVRAGQRAFTLQTLGRGGQLRGVLAVGDEALDEEARGVMTTAVAMTGFALEQTATLARAQGRVRAGVVRALLAGDTALAEEVASGAWGPLPTEPVVVAVTDAAPDALSAFLELHADRARGLRFFGVEPEGGVVMLAETDADPLFDQIAARFGTTIGISRPAGLAGFAAALDEARLTRDRGRGVVRFEESAGGGVLGTLGDAATIIARDLLAPLRRHDAAHGAHILDTVQAWLTHDARFDAAAHALGVHRHTVRSRVTLAERLLDRDLSSFPARAELWAALCAAG